MNESVEPLPTDGAKPIPLPTYEEDEEEDDDDESEYDEEEEDGGDPLLRRWLQEGKIGEEYAGCYSCPNSVRNETCHLVTVYEYNQTVISQCVDTLAEPRGPWVVSCLPWRRELARLIKPSLKYTTDWCYVNGTEFWEPPWDCKCLCPRT